MKKVKQYKICNIIHFIISYSYLGILESCKCSIYMNYITRCNTFLHIY